MQVRLVSEILGPTALARRLGVSIKTLRLYEKAGLIKPRRSPKGWRVYRSEDIARLELALSYRAMGFTLAQIAALLDAAPDALAAALAAQDVRLQTQMQELREALEKVRTIRRRAHTCAAVAKAA